MHPFLKAVRLKTQARIQNLDAGQLAAQSRMPNDFLNLFNLSGQYSIIAEIKFASPSHGKLYHSAPNPCDIAAAYLENGAKAISVLTEPHFFNGDINYIREVRNQNPDALILMKDFIIDPVQLLQACAYGADAVLLIAGFLNQDQLIELYQCALALNLTPLIEVHTEDELQQALQLQPKIIGINNRNLNTLEIDLNQSFKLIDAIPNHIKAISESGISDPAVLVKLKQSQFDGFLIGSAFMRTPSPGLSLGTLLKGAHHES